MMRSQTVHAAETVLTQCLALRPGAELVVFADETTIDSPEKRSSPLKNSIA